jgi:probable rRNA maturation factor
MTRAFSIKNFTRGRIPNLPFARMAAAIVPQMSVSLVFVGDRRSRRLNRQYRGKDKPTNVLSFILDKHEGEIFIHPRLAARQAPRFGRSTKNMIGYLFIHGLLHLKGLEHGSTMDKQEELFCKKFKTWHDTSQQE